MFLCSHLQVLSSNRNLLWFRRVVCVSSKIGKVIFFFPVCNLFDHLRLQQQTTSDTTSKNLAFGKKTFKTHTTDTSMGKNVIEHCAVGSSSCTTHLSAQLASLCLMK